MKSVWLNKARHLLTSAIVWIGSPFLWCGVHHPNVTAQEELPTEIGQQQVGTGRDGITVTPVNQLLTPAGRQIALPGLRPQVAALSPDGELLVVSGKTSQLAVIDPGTGVIRQWVDLPSEEQRLQDSEPVSPNILEPDEKAQVSYTGLQFSSDGKWLYLSNVAGSIKVLRVDKGVVYPSHTIPLPPARAPRRDAEIPAGLAVRGDGTRLFVCGNLSNRLFEIEMPSGKVLRTFDVGVAPYDVVLVDQLAVVSNWGGRRPVDGVTTGPAGRGTEVRVDPVRFIASEGSVSIIDLATGKVSEVLTGLHASALAVSPDRQKVICANAGSDTLSVIDLASRRVVDTLWARLSPSDLLGATPNALCFDAQGQQWFVANGSQNAIAVFDVQWNHRGKSMLKGLIPVGWFPGAIAWDARRRQLCVANIKGLPPTPKQKDDGTEGFNSHHYHGTVSLVPIPTDQALTEFTAQVIRNNHLANIETSLLPPRKNMPPRPVPERIGEPSTIKHVVYIIKENRTYDQVFGALGRGRGRPDLCIFGQEVTPNSHKIVAEFPLLDNTYCSGILSADGHQWSTTAMSTDYMEKSFAGFPRSYPDGMGIDENDALAYSPAGFLWDQARNHGLRIRNYGEFMMPTVRWRDPARDGTPGFMDCYRTWMGESDDVIFECESSIESIRDFSPTGYVGWEMSVPDQYRADFILNELKQFVDAGEFPSLTIICLPNDHTSGTSAGCPTPAACVADNDLAFGRIVAALSHSPFWREMAIFVIEDDPQNGWDHVSGYRTTAFVISPWARRGAIVSTLYNTTSILRTMEQILGVRPMNQFDASATPMFDCFTDIADYTPFDSVPNLVPLDQLNPDPNAIHHPRLRRDAVVSSQLNFREVDAAPEGVLNRILWRAQKGPDVPFPAWAVTLVDDDDD